MTTSPSLLGAVEPETERGVGRGPLDNDGPVGLDAGVEAARLHVRPNRLPRAERALKALARAHRAGHDRDLAAQAEAGTCEGAHGILGVEHADAVVNIETDHEPGPQGVHQETRRRRPGAVRQA
ncbi:hypothetical protein PG996_014060 [Apiospora saccharicola]|uniref:Uncharacterized protein n=1 Tax=Apiospora saccharicola TaxID=335842 RepID=A0ABR1TJ62_9PEZI